MVDVLFSMPAIAIVVLFLGALLGAAVAAFAAGAVSGAIAAFTGIVSGGVLATALSFGLVAAGSTLISGGLQRIFGPDEPDFGSLGDRANRQTQMVRESVKPRFTVYGKQRVSGPVALAEVTDKTKYIHLVIILGEGPYEAIDEVWLDDDVLELDGSGNATGKYSGNVRVKKHLGGENQTADSDLISEVKDWSSTDRLRGVAYIYVRMKHDRELFETGWPNISAVVRGRNDITDPRDSSTGYTTNSALITRHYLLDDVIGIGATTDEINDSEAGTAANDCDDTVGGGETRYTTNGVVQSDRRPDQNLGDMVDSMAGRLFYSEGAYVMKAGKWHGTDFTVDESQLVSGFEVQTRFPKNQLFNAIRGEYMSPENGWNPSDFEPITSTTYEDEDNGQRIWKDVSRNFTITNSEARRISRVTLNRARRQKTLQPQWNLSMLRGQVGDVIGFSYDRYAWDEKTFIIIQWRFSIQTDEDGNRTVVIETHLQETDSDVYADQVEPDIGIRSPVLEFVA